MFPFLATVVFVIWLTYELKKHNRINQKVYDDFWENEQKANLVRKKSLDGLPYITIPMEYIPKSLLNDDPAVADCISTLETLSEQKIVNLTGYTNTELKFNYGAANLPTLMEYDDNYTVYARTMNRLAQAYYDAGYESNARILLEKAVESQPDIKATYLLLAKIYKKHKETEKLYALLAKAEDLHSSSKDAIMHALQECVRTD